MVAWSRKKATHRVDARRSADVASRSIGLIGLCVALLASGCSSLPPVRAIQAARYYAAGTRALDRGDAGSAIAELERAAALMPEASEIHNHLGLAYWSDARSAEALRELERAVALDCDNDEARVNLALFRAASEARSEGSDSNGG